jgi:hypothetical protein
LNPQYSQALSMLEQESGASGAAQMLGVFLFCLVPLSGIMNLVNTAISVGIMHLMAKILGGKGKYSDFLYLVAAYSAPMTIGMTILGIIPFVGACLALPLSLWGLNLNIQAAKSAHNFDTIRALGSVVGVILLAFLFICLLFVLFYSSLAAYIPITFPTPTY